MALPFNDVTDAGVVRRALELAIDCLQQGLKIFVWYAFPCTSWASWQYINIAAADTEQKQRIEEARQKSEQMIQTGVQFFLDLREVDPAHVA